MPIETPLLRTFQSAWSRSKHSKTHTFVADVPEVLAAEPSYMSVRLHVIRLPDDRMLENLPPDEIPHWGDSASEPTDSRLRENILYGRLDPAFHCLPPHRPSDERQSSPQTHRKNMERFTSYLQRRKDAGLDLEGTLLDLLDQTEFEPLTDDSRYCMAKEESSVKNEARPWSITIYDSTEYSALLSIDVDPDKEGFHQLIDKLQLGDDRPAKRYVPSGPSGSATC